MKVIEVTGGLYTMVQQQDFKLIEQMIAKKIKNLKKDELSEKVQVIAQRLVDSHVLDFDGEYYYLREVHIDV